MYPADALCAVLGALALIVVETHTMADDPAVRVTPSDPEGAEAKVPVQVLAVDPFVQAVALVAIPTPIVSDEENAVAVAGPVSASTRSCRAVLPVLVTVTAAERVAVG